MICSFSISNIRGGAEGGEDEADRRPKVTVLKHQGDENVVAKLTTATAGAVGGIKNVVGKGLGGLTSKLGTGSWF